MPSMSLTAPAVTPSLSSVLSTGNTSGATDLIINASQGLVIGGATTSGVRLEVNSGVLTVREGDDSADAQVRVLESTLASGTAGVVFGTNDSDGGAIWGGSTVFTLGLADASQIMSLTCRNITGRRLSSTVTAYSLRCQSSGDEGLNLHSGATVDWSSSATDADGTSDAGLKRNAAGVVQVTDGSTGRGSLRADWPRREFSVHKTPGTAATLTAVGGTPTHTLSGTASNVSDSSGHYVQLSADTAVAGVDIATTECTKTENGPIVTFVIKTGAVLPIATERIWVGLSSASLAGTDSPTGAHVLAFRYGPSTDGTAFWRASSNDGGADTGTTTVTTAAIATSTRYVLTIDATNSASVTFFVNGALVATHATNLPTATTALGTQCFVDDVAGGSTKEMLISKIQYETN